MGACQLGVRYTLGEMRSRQLGVSHWYLVLFLLTSSCIGQRLECYHCHSEGNGRCINILEGKPPIEPTLCLADTQSVGRPRCLKDVKTVNGRQVVRRTCVMARLDDFDAACDYSSDETTHCSLCDSDRCNGASRYSTPSWLLLWVSIIFVTWRIL